MRDERDLSGVCNKVCLEPLYTGKCKEECVKRYRKVFAVTDPASLRPKGEWENDKGDVYWHNHFIHKHCSVCGAEALHDFPMGNYKLTNFCPNCGADMRGNPNDS